MADLQRRIDELTAVATEHMPGDPTERFAHLLCDGCGATAKINLAAPSAPGWQLGPPDYCPGCVG